MAGQQIKVKVTADVDDYKRGLRDAEQDAKKFDGALGRLGAGTVGLGNILSDGAQDAAEFAKQLAVDSVQAALSDEAAVDKLSQTLNNLGLAGHTQDVEAFIGHLQAETGVVDDDLRPAFERLVRSTKDVREAHRALGIAVDISAGKGKSLDAIVNALGKGYDGNLNALGRLGLGLDKIVIKSGSMATVTEELSSLYSGQASRAAETYQGRIQLLEVAADEAKETFGYGLLTALDDVSDALGGTDGLVSMLEETADAATDTVVGIGEIVSMVADLDASVEGIDLGPVGDGIAWIADAAWDAINPLNDVIDGIQKLGDESRARQMSASNIGADYQKLADYHRLTTAAGLAEYNRAHALERRAEAEEKAAAAEKRRREAERDRAKAASAAAAADREATAAVAEMGRQTLATANDQLEPAIDTVASLRKEMADYSTSLADVITGTVSLSDAWNTEQDTTKAAEAGEGTAVSWVEAFRRQIADAEQFGSVLAELQRSGASQTLIDQVSALGPAAGVEIGRKMIADGLAPALSAELSKLDADALGIGSAISGSFYGSGVDAAVAMLKGTIAQVRASKAELIATGKEIGAPIGAQIEQEIKAAIARAVGEAKAAKEVAAQAAADAERAKASTVNVTFTGLVTDPVAVARQIQSTMALAGLRTGTNFG